MLKTGSYSIRTPLGSEGFAGSSTRKHACPSHVALILWFIPCPSSQFGRITGARAPGLFFGYDQFNRVNAIYPRILIRL